MYSFYPLTGSSHYISPSIHLPRFLHPRYVWVQRFFCLIHVDIASCLLKASQSVLFWNKFYFIISFPIAKIWLCINDVFLEYSKTLPFPIFDCFQSILILRSFSYQNFKHECTFSWQQSITCDFFYCNKKILTQSDNAL